MKPRSARTLVLAAFLSFVGQAAAADAAFSLPALPYAADALEPVIDARTMEIHHGRHHKAYVDNLNAKVGEFPALAGLSIEQVQARISSFDAAVRNNAGGHYNHSLFWTLMAPGGKGQPSKALAARIDRDFGSLEAFKKAFAEAGTKQFGSGWAWLVVKPDGALAVTSTANQDNPLMDVAPVRGTPLLAVDVWEHAYYLQYQNRRGDYLARWWDVVNWDEVNRRYEAVAARG